MEDSGPSAAYLLNLQPSSSNPARPSSPPLGPTDILEAEDRSDPSEPDQALYSLLNLPPSASDAEIRERYRALVVTYHPDRQRSDEARVAAHRQFQSIQRAYEVLSDVESRTVYDLYGEEGLRMRAAERQGETGLQGPGAGQIGRPNMTPQELREHFQTQYVANKAIEAENLVKSRGDMTAVLDARAVFAPKKAFRDQALPQDPISRMGRLRVGQINMKHSFELPVDFGEGSKGVEKGRARLGQSQGRTSLQIQGQMAARNGAGGGNIVGTVKHQFSPSCWAEVGYSLMHPRIATAKGAYSIDEYTYMTGNLISPTFLAPPTIGLQLGRRLYANTTGFISYKSGFFTLGPWGASLPPALQRPDRSALSVGLTNSSPDGKGWTVETQAGVIANHVSADYSFGRWMGVRWKVGAAVGTDTGINAFVDAESKVSTVSRVGVVVSVELGGGVSMRCKFSRMGQRISIPILLSQNLNPYIVLGTTVLPFSAYAAAYHFVLMPRKRRRQANRAGNLRTQHAEHIAQTRRDAIEAIELMSRSVANKTAAEREKGGLIILEASYGLASAFTERAIRRTRPTSREAQRESTGLDDGDEQSEEDEVVIDVTIPVQALVMDSKLSIPGGRGKNSILGFWDPCIGEPKKLRIRYLFRERLHQVTIDDEQAVRMPVKEHCLDPVE